MIETSNFLQIKHTAVPFFCKSCKTSSVFKQYSLVKGNFKLTCFIQSPILSQKKKKRKNIKTLTVGGDDGKSVNSMLMNFLMRHSMSSRQKMKVMMEAIVDDKMIVKKSPPFQLMSSCAATPPSAVLPKIA